MVTKMVNKTMISPLIIGFLCFFVSIVGALGPVTHTFTTNDRGQVVTTSNSGNISSALVLGENGYTTGGWFPSTVYVNNQTGNTSFRVYDISMPSGSHQFWQYLIPNGSADIIIEYTHGNGLDGNMLIKGPSNSQTYSLAALWSVSKNNNITQTLDMGNVLVIGGGSQVWNFDLVITAYTGTFLYTDLYNGHNYSVSINAVHISTTGAFGDIFGANGIMIILIAALIIGGVAAITVFGSGIDFFGQKLIFISAAYVVLWAILSVGMYGLIISIPVVGVLIWLAISAMYFLGVVQEALGGEEMAE
jgi:hypothetical protein